MIPITRLNIGEAEAKAAADTVLSGWLMVGKQCRRFEEMVAEYVGARHAVAVNSCTTALHLALIAAGIGPGDEVICPSFSFIASANAILYAGATPKFVDINPKTFNIEPRFIESAITENTKAILPVSQIGLPADIPAIMEIANHYNLKIVEDAAPSLGSMINGNYIGSISDYTCFSFDARKILTTGEGGMITTNDEKAANLLRRIRAHGASSSTADRHKATQVTFEEYCELGYNYKLTDIQGAIGVIQMGKINDVVNERRRLAERYNLLLSDEGRVILPFEPKGWRHVYQSYCVRLNTKKPQNEVMNEMAKKGVATRRIMAIHFEELYKKLYPEISLPVTEKATRETLLLPIFVGLTNSEQEEVVDTLKRALD
jgi:dTDP-4-amino-4,6-dideoxygalactose transaminase